MVEDIILSQGGYIFLKKVTKFMKTLTIKLDSEANENERKDWLDSYHIYKMAKLKRDSFHEYSLFQSDLVENLPTIFSTESETDIYIKEKARLNDMIGSNSYVSQYLQKLRDRRVNDYIEFNPYFNILLGKPDPAEGNRAIVNVQNRDIENYGKPGISIVRIPVHTVTQLNYPKTYNWLFARNGIEKVISDNPDLLYLRHLGDPMDLIEARDARNFSILKYQKDILTESETAYFLDMYDEIIDYINRVSYVEDFAQRYDNYDGLMLYIVLSIAFSRFINYTLKRYSVRNYTRGEIFTILDSYNLNNLKSLDFSILQKVVENIRNLIKDRASEKSFIQILDILNIESSSVRRYNIQKVYSIKNGQTYLDKNKSICKNVDLEFIDKNIYEVDSQVVKGDNSSVLTYSEMTQNDSLWGSSLGPLVNNSELVQKHKNQFKNELIHHQFSRLQSKYLIVSQTISDDRDSLKWRSNAFGFLLQQNERNGFLLKDKIDYKNNAFSPIDFLALITWGIQVIDKKMIKNDHPDFDPDAISPQLYKSDGVLKYRDDSDRVKAAQSILDTKIYYIRFNRTVTFKEYCEFERENRFQLNEKKERVYQSRDKIFEDPHQTLVDDYLVYYKIDDKSFHRSIQDRDNDNKQIMAHIRDQMVNSSTYVEYVMYKTIYDHNIVNYVSPSIQEHFSPHTTYKSFFDKSIHQKYYQGLYDQYYTVDDKKTFNKTINDMIETWNLYLKNKTKTEKNPNGVIQWNVRQDINTDDSKSQIESLRILLDEFSSIYSSLYLSEYFYNFTDYPFNMIVVRFDEANIAEEIDVVEIIRIFWEGDVSYHWFDQNTIQLEYINTELRLSESASIQYGVPAQSPIFYSPPPFDSSSLNADSKLNHKTQFDFEMTAIEYGWRDELIINSDFFNTIGLRPERSLNATAFANINFVLTNIEHIV